MGLLQEDLLDLSDEDDPEQDRFYELVLYFTKSRMDILRGWLFLAGEICLNEKGRRKLIRDLVRARKGSK